MGAASEWERADEYFACGPMHAVLRRGVCARSYEMAQAAPRKSKNADSVYAYSRCRRCPVGYEHSQQEALVPAVPPPVQIRTTAAEARKCRGCNQPLARDRGFRLFHDHHCRSLAGATDYEGLARMVERGHV